jgi:DNA polymerase-3 subunit gamma/tau
VDNTFLVTARKYRPQTFADVVGQNHITRTLKNAILQNRVHHAYLFNGPRGVGKTTTARIFARALNCLNSVDGEPCNICESCKNSLDSRSLDIIEIDGASNNSVDDIRKLRENAKFPPVQSKYKMYIIDEVHMLSTSAFNALLKTLEEPPSHLIFVFATTEPHKVPPTILSRCQRYDFRRMEINDITRQLSFVANKEGIVIDEQSLFAIAKKADGSMRDSESVFDQVVSYSGNNIEYSSLTEALHLIDEDFFFEITDNIFTNDIHKMFEIAEQITKKGYDYVETINGLIEHLRNLLSVKATKDTTFLQVSDPTKLKFIQSSQKFSTSDLLRIIQYVTSSENQIKFSSQQRIRFELILSYLASMVNSTNLAEIINSIKLDPIQTESNVITPQPKAQVPEKTQATIIQSTPKPTQANPPMSEIQSANNKTATPQPSKSLDADLISAKVLQSKWDDFLIDKANADNMSTTLNQQKVEFAENKVIIHFTSEIIFNNYNEIIIKKNLKKILDEYFKGNIQIEMILDKNSSSENKIELPKPKQTSKSDSSPELHKKVMEIFNAQKINS